MCQFTAQVFQCGDTVIRLKRHCYWGGITKVKCPLKGGKPDETVEIKDICMKCVQRKKKEDHAKAVIREVVAKHNFNTRTSERLKNKWLAEQQAKMKRMANAAPTATAGEEASTSTATSKSHISSPFNRPNLQVNSASAPVKLADEKPTLPSSLRQPPPDWFGPPEDAAEHATIVAAWRDLDKVHESVTELAQAVDDAMDEASRERDAFHTAAKSDGEDNHDRAKNACKDEEDEKMDDQPTTFNKHQPLGLARLPFDPVRDQSSVRGVQSNVRGVQSNVRGGQEKVDYGACQHEIPKTACAICSKYTAEEIEAANTLVLFSRQAFVEEALKY